MGESYIVVISSRKGQRAAVRHTLNIPVALARGRYEELSDRALNDFIKDAWHEQRRRAGDELAQPAARWNPDKALYYGDPEPDIDPEDS